MLASAHLRIARATEDLPRLVDFSSGALGFDVIGSFEDHDGFDGVMLGHAGAGYHLEFTHRHGEEVGSAPTEENLLVFYLPDPAKWQAAVDHMRANGVEPVAPANRYWALRGVTFEDPDGYRIGLENSAWSR
ncbi:MAG: VOC family protein [Verrucomicrobiota bacterium]|nr:VOC family protein [Verrucomicrobiota bacterium]